MTGTADVHNEDMLALGPVVIRLHGTDTSEEGRRCEFTSDGIWACRAAALAWVDVLATNRKLACLARHVDLYERVVEGGAVVGRVDGVGTVLTRKEPDWAFLAHSDLRRSTPSVMRGALRLGS